MQGIFRKENTDKALKYGIYRHLPTYEKIIRNLVSFYTQTNQKTSIKFVQNLALLHFSNIFGIIIKRRTYENNSNRQCKRNRKER